ncbi:MAG: response regulator [Candidatus Omnitrophica bacterium]|nr:response regulator [Candidatus Omnitrophota bacterium]
MKRRILIIDGDAVAQLIYKKSINLMGNKLYEVVEAGNAREATNYFIRNQVDLVITEIKLPDVDGVEMFDIIKEFNPDMKVIIASVYPLDKQQQLFPLASGYYNKTEGMDQLMERISCTVVHQNTFEPIYN